MLCVEKCSIRNNFRSATLSSWSKAEVSEESSLRTRTKDDFLQDFITEHISSFLLTRTMPAQYEMD